MIMRIIYIMLNRAVRVVRRSNSTLIRYDNYLLNHH